MLDITEVARRSGLPASALRYYEQQGLITSIGRRGLRRLFDDEVLTRISLILLGQAAGFSLSRIAAMLGAAAVPQIDRAQLAEQADALDRSIAELTALRDGLRHVMNCTAPRHFDCPKFQRILRVGSARQVLRRSTSATLRDRPAQTR